MDTNTKPRTKKTRPAAPWTGQKLYKVWAESCPWSSVGFSRFWGALHPHYQEKWQELAKTVNGGCRHRSPISGNGSAFLGFCGLASQTRR